MKYHYFLSYASASGGWGRVEGVHDGPITGMADIKEHEILLNKEYPSHGEHVILFWKQFPNLVDKKKEKIK